VEIQVAIIILEVAVIIGALAVFLIATILQLFKINAGLSVVLPLVGQIVAKTGPVNPVVDDINANLVVTRDALENLMLKKGGPDAAGLVESLFPGEGAKFLKRVNRSGKVVNVGTVYTRGVGILAGLGRGAPIGAAHTKGAAVRDAQYSTTEVAKLYPAPPDRRNPDLVIPKLRPLRYDPHNPLARPVEKGIDVQIAIGALEAVLTRTCDIAVVFSHDTDLLPAIESIARLKGRQAVETAGWSSSRFRSRLRPKPLVYHHEVTEQVYRRVETPVNFAYP